MGLFDNEEDELKTPDAPTVQNPSVREYLLKRMAERESLVSQNKESATGDKISALLGTIGAGMMGKDAGAAGQAILARQDAQKKSKLNDFDSGTDRYVKENEIIKGDELFQRESDLSSQESKMANELATRMGYKGAPITATQFKGFSPALQKMYDIEQKKLDRQDAREERRSLFGFKQQERQDAKDLKREERDLTLAVPGYERTGEVLPKPEEAAKFRKSTAVSKQLNDKLSRMKELVKEYGSFEYGGEGGQEMESLATEIQLLGKSPELYELGVLTGPDLTLLQKITSDPSSLSSLFTFDSTRNKQLDSQIKSIQDKLGATASSMGYAKAGEKQQKKITKTQTNQKTGEKRIVYDDGTIEIVNPVAGR